MITGTKLALYRDLKELGNDPSPQRNSQRPGEATTATFPLDDFVPLHFGPASKVTLSSPSPAVIAPAAAPASEAPTPKPQQSASPRIESPEEHPQQRVASEEATINHGYHQPAALRFQSSPIPTRGSVISIRI